MIIGDRVPFQKENRSHYYGKNDEICLFGNVVSYDNEMVCISYMRQLFFVKRSDVENLMEEIKNK